MAHISSTDHASILSTRDRETLLAHARRSIASGLEGERLAVRPDEFSAMLAAPAASFVTLRIGAELRGCIGTLEAERALIVDVVSNAYSSAFRDPRFAPVTRGEFDELDIHISVLSAPEPMSFGSEVELLAQLRPGIDGLVLEEGAYRGTFLPAVWEQLAEPHDFLRQLKRKAGLPVDYWSATLRVSRYTASSIP
ncbi:MAG: AmmeMemoRadiSam system protein A [Pseudomonadota bacterium]|nr:MAG: AmmeMemoRadiSam system protein A [Pseudomonadota bacterium]